MILLALLGQALIVAVAAWILPDASVDGFWSAFFVAVIIGIVRNAGGLGHARPEPTRRLSGRLVSSSRRHPAVIDDPEMTGVVFVQLDGVPYPVLHMAVMAGTVPTLSRWIRDGSHQLHEWTPKLPATTPASQMGILHGVIDGIPAFRWYDRANDKVLVANRPGDATLIEEHASRPAAGCWSTAA